jgi:hypothetical protein
LLPVAKTKASVMRHGRINVEFDVECEGCDKHCDYARWMYCTVGMYSIKVSQQFIGRGNFVVLQRRYHWQAYADRREDVQVYGVIRNHRGRTQTS